LTELELMSNPTREGSCPPNHFCMMDIVPLAERP